MTPPNPHEPHVDGTEEHVPRQQRHEGAAARTPEADGTAGHPCTESAMGQPGTAGHPGTEGAWARSGGDRPGGELPGTESAGAQPGGERPGTEGTRTWSDGEQPGAERTGASPDVEPAGAEGVQAWPGGERAAADRIRARSERVPLPRAGGEAAEGGAALSHDVLRSLLGAWALAACSGAETEAVEEHLGDCGSCAEEARRLREAVELLHRPEPLDVDPTLRARVLETCLSRRPPRIPVPDWADAYDAETARLDALLQDFGDAEWHAPVRLRWFGAEGGTSRRTTVAGVIAHLLSVDGLVATALGLEDPLAEALAEQARGTGGPAERTEAFWRASHFPPTRHVREPWRDQSHRLVRTASFTGGRARGFEVSYGDFALPLHDAMLDRAFECWVHAEDIAKAVHYPYDPPAPRHLGKLIDLAIRMLPAVLAAGPQAPPGTVLLEIEGSPYGNKYVIPLDPRTPDADQVAQVALDGVEFCRLAAGHVSPEEAAAGQKGDRDAIRTVLTATASLSRM
ncbi:zf-HC2 domain-containing protein [Streptomyces sp. DSM 110735]|nr:zf-HC2 domain-containing protein [Streptomyces sp. DSM 110735]MBJ7906682.1 zf-HC2 domain-containing protein [Streptomyces sp. DSM 110735]